MESVVNDWITENKNESLNMLHIEYCIGHSGNVMKKCGLVYEGTLR